MMRLVVCVLAALALASGAGAAEQPGYEPPPA
jgi:hypothetical protein